MIHPKNFQVGDFLSPTIVSTGDEKADLSAQDKRTRSLNAINAEALSGSELVDNLILLQFCDLIDIKNVLGEKYSMPFAWLNVDPTPDEFREIADKHHVLIEKGRNLVVYVPLGAEVDDATLQVDIPNYQCSVRYIADCNYNLLHTGYPPTMLSFKVAQFKPILVFRRLAMECIDKGGTDLHLLSFYEHKQPTHHIKYRVTGDMVDSDFSIDLEMMQAIVQEVVSKLTTASAMDIDSLGGVTTDIRDLFRDGTCDVRVNGARSSAGFDMDFAIQQITTTTMTIDELGFPQEDILQIRELAQHRTGLTLVTGEMRSGKNTTIFAMINELIDQPIRIVEFSNPIENFMPFSQFDYKGDIDLLKQYMVKSKKWDIDVAVLNEIPNAEVAFAVRDLVNSAIGVITTTHVNRVWHTPQKLREFFGEDYKTIISQLNAVITQKRFKRWICPGAQKRTLVKENGKFEMMCYRAGVRQYFVPTDASKVQYKVQPMVEIVEFTDSMKSAMLHFDENWKAEEMIQNQINMAHATLENKVAQYVNQGIFSLDEMHRFY